jgi:hypothetical protein
MLVSGVGVNALLTPTSNKGIMYGLRVIASIGAGLLFPIAAFATQVTQTDEDLGIATSTDTFLRSMGQAFGVAIGGTVFQNEFDRHVRLRVASGSIPPTMIIGGQGAENAFAYLKTFPRSVQIAYEYVYADSLRTLWYVLTGIGGIGLLFSLLQRNESMDRDLNSKQKFQHEGKVTKEFRKTEKEES